MSENKCCGNCRWFANEDVDGYGWCELTKEEVSSWVDNLPCHEKPNNGWTEITPDNVDEVYNIDQNRLVVQLNNGNYPMTRMCRDFSATLSTMAKMGGYYYYVLPELIRRSNHE